MIVFPMVTFITIISVALILVSIIRLVQAYIEKDFNNDDVLAAKTLLILGIVFLCMMHL